MRRKSPTNARDAKGVGFSSPSSQRAVPPTLRGGGGARRAAENRANAERVATTEPVGRYRTQSAGPSVGTSGPADLVTPMSPAGAGVPLAPLTESPSEAVDSYASPGRVQSHSDMGSYDAPGDEEGGSGTQTWQSVHTGSVSPKGMRLRQRPGGIQVPSRGRQGTDSEVLSPLSPPTRKASDRPEAASCSISVVVRVRPALPRERMDSPGIDCLPDGKSLVLTDGEQKRQFTVDEVIDSRPTAPMDGSQSTVYKSVGGKLLLESMKGYNVCLFAYGHTGSGKTYTVLGVSGGVCAEGAEAGLLPRFLADIFRTNAQDPNRKNIRYRAEFYEVHNEQIRDLLAPVREDRRRTIHVHPVHGVRIDGLCTAVVSSPEEAMGLVNFGNQMRTVAATTMNERSSRSHAVFTVNWETEDDGDIGYRSSATFVDLAGREDSEAHTGRGDHYKEMCYINTSLFHLARLITKLSEGHVTKGSLADFRNSKLTLLLSQALIGNSRTALVATLAPVRTYYDDSVSTMNFAANVKKIMTKPMVNAKTGTALVTELEKEIFNLRKELADAKVRGGEKEENLLAAQAMMQYYKTSFEEMSSKSEEHKQMRKSMTEMLGLPDTFGGDASHPRTAEGKLVPFFTKLSDDPSLQGCCNYFLSKSTLTIGQDSSCDIVLQGVGIRPNMCGVKFDAATGAVSILFLDPEDAEDPPRVIVARHPMKEGREEVQMSHDDPLVLGYAHAFRLVDPERAPNFADINSDVDSTSELAQKLCASLDMCTAVQDVVEETGSQFKECYHYLQQFAARAPEKAVQSFMHDLRIACPLVDEANEIREQIYKVKELQCELRCLTDFLDFANDAPELVVCVIHNPHLAAPRDKFRSLVGSALLEGGMIKTPSTLKTKRWMVGRDTLMLRGAARHPMASALGLANNMDAGGRSLLYVWSMEKFLRRLTEMRELSDEGTAANDGFESVRRRLDNRPYLNPWREMTFGDVKQISEHAKCYSVMNPHMDGHSKERATPGGSLEAPHSPLTPRGWRRRSAPALREASALPVTPTPSDVPTVPVPTATPGGMPVPHAVSNADPASASMHAVPSVPSSTPRCDSVEAPAIAVGSTGSAGGSAILGPTDAFKGSFGSSAAESARSRHRLNSGADTLQRSSISGGTSPAPDAREMPAVPERRRPEALRRDLSGSLFEEDIQLPIAPVAPATAPAAGCGSPRGVSNGAHGHTKVKVFQRDLDDMRRELHSCRAGLPAEPDTDVGRLGGLLDKFETLLLDLVPLTSRRQPSPKSQAPQSPLPARTSALSLDRQLGHESTTEQQVPVEPIARLPFPARDESLHSPRGTTPRGTTPRASPVKMWTISPKRAAGVKIRRTVSPLPLRAVVTRSPSPPRLAYHTLHSPRAASPRTASPRSVRVFTPMQFSLSAAASASAAAATATAGTPSLTKSAPLLAKGYPVAGPVMHQAYSPVVSYRKVIEEPACSVRS